MSRQDWFLTLSEEIGHALNDLYLPALLAFIAEAGLEGTDLWIAQSALSAEPEAMTAFVILERAPYVNEGHIQAQMTQSASRGVLTAVASHTYNLTPQGRHFAHAVPTIVYKAFQAMDDTIPPETHRLVELLSTLVTASLDAPEPTTKAALQRSRFYDPGPQGHILERLRRALNDLAAFRDDAHLASWYAYGVTGVAWEAFSHIHGRFTWGDPVTTAVELAQKLDFRGYDETAYPQALDPLVTRGWLTDADGVYRLTDKGERVRQTAENETDRLFYAPWPLDDTELAELKGLMEKVSLSLQPPPPATIWQIAYELRSHISKHYMPALQAAIEEAAFTHAQFHAAGAQDAPLFQLVRAISALAAFRDDAHVAAWRDTGVEGHQWEVFSHVHAANSWGNLITNTAEAAEKFAFRGYDEAAYQAALLDCLARGWLLVDEDARFTTTKTGQTLWQEIEDKTNQLFYEPWQTLTVPERFELH